MAFTTWTALAEQMRNDLADGSWRRQSYSIDDRQVAYTNPKDFLAMLEYVELRAARETGAFVPRTYASPGALS